jgi:hypothetical protein
MKTYVVTIDNPYYPAVYYFPTLRQAQVKKEALLTEHAVQEERRAEHEAWVVLAEVIDSTPIQTDH